MRMLYNPTGPYLGRSSLWGTERPPREVRGPLAIGALRREPAARHNCDDTAHRHTHARRWLCALREQMLARRVLWQPWDAAVCSVLFTRCENPCVRVGRAQVEQTYIRRLHARTRSTRCAVARPAEREGVWVTHGTHGQSVESFAFGASDFSSAAFSQRFLPSHIMRPFTHVLSSAASSPSIKLRPPPPPIARSPAARRGRSAARARSRPVAPARRPRCGASSLRAAAAARGSSRSRRARSEARGCSGTRASRCAPACVSRVAASRGAQLVGARRRRELLESARRAPVWPSPPWAAPCRPIDRREHSAR